jgi:Ca-activated chloride channel homolog
MFERPRRQSASRTVTFHLKRRTLLMLPLVGLLFGAAPYAQPGESRQRPAPPSASFRASVDVVSLNVTVSDGENRLVLDLDWPDFSVFEDGIKQDVTFFTRERQSLALSLLLDSSSSMGDHLPMLHAAATTLVQRLGPSDVAQIVDFDSRVHVRQPFTANQAKLEGAIRETIANGSTSLYSAVYIALKELGKVRVVSEVAVRRQALIVFSDGEDTSSLVSFDDVLDLARRSETAVYAIAFRGPDKQPSGFREAEYVLRTIAQETGGRAFLQRKIDNLADVYAQIGEELASQYTIGYTPKNAKHDGAWRRVIVQVSRPNTRARAKNGYYAPRTRPTAGRR